MPKGKRVRSSAKNIICNVYDYFERQNKKQKTTTTPKLCKKTADATGYSERTVNCVLKEKRGLEGGSFSTPKRYKESRERLNVHVDSFDIEAIRCTVHAFYDRREYPTLDKLLHVLEEKELFKGGRISLWKLLIFTQWCI